MLVLIPKGDADTWVIGLLKFLWKVAGAVKDTCIKTVVQFHYVLQGFCAGRGMGNSTMKLRPVQKLAIVYQDPLFLVFLDQRNSHVNLYLGQLIQMLTGYRAVPKLRGLLEEFWLNQEVVTYQNRFHGPQLQATQGTTQGGMDYTKLFNVVVDSVVRYCLSLTVQDESGIRDGLRMVVVSSMGMFYADDGLIISRYPEWL